MNTTDDLDDARDDINWARFWLATPERDLPGTLTHATCRRVLEDAKATLWHLEGPLTHIPT